MDELQKQNEELNAYYTALNTSAVNLHMEYLELTSLNRLASQNINGKETVTDTELEDLRYFLNTCLDNLGTIQEGNIKREKDLEG